MAVPHLSFESHGLMFFSLAFLGIDKFGGSIDGAVCLSEGIMFICESSSNIGEN